MTHGCIDSRRRVSKTAAKVWDTARGVLLSRVFAGLGFALGLGLMHQII